MGENHVISQILITFGGLFLIGLIADIIGHKTPVPRVTLLLLVGFLIGPSALDWLPVFTERWFPVLTNIALSMIGFMLGQKLSLGHLKQLGRQVLGISFFVVTLTAASVFSVLFLFGVSFELSLLLAAIATATAPAATVDVVKESQAQGGFTDSLLGIVAIDDAWGLLIFSIVMAIVDSSLGNDHGVSILMTGLLDLGGGVLLGGLLGLPMAFLSGRIRPGEQTQAETLGMVLLCAGLASWFTFSYLLASMVMGAVVAMFSHHCERPFRVVESFEWPLFILFFLLAGASLHIQAVGQVGLIGVVYIVIRVCGRLIGGALGGRVMKASPMVTRWMGAALLPQAGVAIGMALMASQHYPEIKPVLLPIVLGSTIVFELVGPILTRLALVRAGDIVSDPVAGPE